jgi:hypothetical protein
MDRDFLKVGNHRKISNVYAVFLTPAEVHKINAEIQKHTRLIFDLAFEHYTFSVSLRKKQWRQRISWLYYASYNASKAVRFDHDGNHSTDVKDHSKVGLLPDGFPDKATYENELKNLREDRNSCDYDHLATKNDLLKQPDDYQVLVLNFLRHAHDHLTARGNILGGKP